MKLNQLLVISIAAFVAVAAFNSVSSFKRQPSIPLEIVSAHGLWAQTYGKVYSSPEEQSFRLAIFHETASRINAHNSNPDKTYTQGLNQFSDMTDEEFRVKFGMPEMTPEDIDAFNSLPVAYESEKIQSLGDADWRGNLPPILNQGSCGSCWAFAAADAAEARYNRKQGTREQFSPQQILDCSNGGNCQQGGYPFKALQYLSSNGANLLSAYPYKGVQGACQNIGNKRSLPYTVQVIGDKSLNGYTNWSNNGVFVVIIRTSKGIRNYSGGVYSDTTCSNDYGNHVITLVGYTSQAWILRNSWGTGWGEQGYFRFQRSTNNICGIYDYGMIYA